MLHPNQFRVNEAWVLCKLNDAPILTDSDGDFNLFALMDAASCFILSTAPVPTTQTEPSKTEARRLLKKAQAHKQQFPKTLFIQNDLPANLLTIEAERQGVAIVCVPSDQLQPIVGEARESFKERFGGGSTQ